MLCLMLWMNQNNIEVDEISIRNEKNSYTWQTLYSKILG